MFGWCLHNWSTWSEPAPCMVDNKDFKYFRVEMNQEKSCEKCHIVKYRKVH